MKLTDLIHEPSEANAEEFVEYVTSNRHLAGVDGLVVINLKLASALEVVDSLLLAIDDNLQAFGEVQYVLLRAVIKHQNNYIKYVNEYKVL